jgi:hypothetical protein
MFVINKTSMPGGGLAEERRQRATEQIAKIAGIAKIGNLKGWRTRHRGANVGFKATVFK